MNPSSRPSKMPVELPASTEQLLNMYAIAASAAGVGSKTPAELSASTQQQLNMYAIAASAAGVGLLALVQPAEAKIIYTKTYQVVSHLHPAHLDLNHDGINDFVIATYYAAGSGSIAAVRAYQFPKFYGANRIMGKGNYAYAFRAGVEIGPKKQFNPRDSRMASFVMTGPSSKTYFRGLWANDGKGVKNRYLGLRFMLHGKLHFGWARVKITWNNRKYDTRGVHQGCCIQPTGFLTGYAYETIPNKPIIAGAIKGPDDSEPTASFTMPTPEPATLGLLAAGSPGLSIWRREEAMGAVQ